MVKRLFLTPPNLPAATTTRCIEIPNSREWFGIFNAALLLTAQAHNYEQVNDTDMTPEDVAEICYSIYVAYLEGCTPMDCNDVLACFMAANVAPLGDVDIRADPVNGEPQFSADGGTTWTDIPGDPDAAPVTPTLEPTPGATNADKACLAASRAAVTISEFYNQTYGAFTAGLFNALRDINNFLYQLNSALLGLAYGQAAQAAQGLLWAGYDWNSDLTAATLTAQQIEDLTCLIFEHASVNAEGIVTFDYQAVADNLISTLGLNPGTAVLSLVAYLQAPGLDQAGQVENVAPGSEDCTPCAAGGWSQQIFNGAGIQGFTPQFYVGVTGYPGCTAVYDAINDRLPACYCGQQGGRYVRGASMVRNFAGATHLDTVQIVVSSNGVGQQNSDNRIQIQYWLGGVLQGTSVSQVYNGTVNFTPNVDCDNVRVFYRSYDADGAWFAQIDEMTFASLTGSNPF